MLRRNWTLLARTAEDRLVSAAVQQERLQFLDNVDGLCDRKLAHLLRQKSLTISQMRPVFDVLSKKPGMGPDTAAFIMDRASKQDKSFSLLWDVVLLCGTRRIPVTPAAVSHLVASLAHSGGERRQRNRAFAIAKHVHSQFGLSQAVAEEVLSIFVPYREEFELVMHEAPQQLGLAWTSSAYAMRLQACAVSADEALALWGQLRHDSQAAATSISVLLAVVDVCLRYRDPDAARDALVVAAAQHGVASAAAWLPLLRANRCVSAHSVKKTRDLMIAHGVTPTFKCLLLYLEACVDSCRERGDMWHMEAVSVATKMRDMNGQHNPVEFVRTLEVLMEKTGQPDRLADLLSASGTQATWLQNWDSFLKQQPSQRRPAVAKPLTPRRTVHGVPPLASAA